MKQQQQQGPPVTPPPTEAKAEPRPRLLLPANSQEATATRGKRRR
jgi:hypothetical protein